MQFKRNWNIYTQPPEILTPDYIEWPEEVFFVFLKSAQPVVWGIEGEMFMLEGTNKLSLISKLQKGDKFSVVVRATDEYNNTATKTITVEYKKPKQKVYQEVQPIPSNFRISKS